MENKKYSLWELSQYNRTYNDMIKFLKETIPCEKRPEILQKFEDKALEDDDRANGLKAMLNINGLGAMATTLMVMFGIESAIGATLVTAPYTALYYIWSKHVLKQSKLDKEACLRFIQTVSEQENNIKYPFTIGNDDNFEVIKKYSKSVRGMNSEGIINYFRQLENEKQLN